MGGVFVYGMVNRCVQGAIESRYGSRAWDEVLMAARVDVEIFILSESCPEEGTQRILRAAESLLRRPLEDLLYEVRAQTERSAELVYF